MVQNAKGVQVVLLLQVLKDVEKDGIKIAWRHRIEEFTDLIVTGDRLDAKQGLSVIASLTVVELALVLQKRRRLHEKDTKGP
jgi:hypothetical protein